MTAERGYAPLPVPEELSNVDKNVLRELCPQHLKSHQQQGPFLPKPGCKPCQKAWRICKHIAHLRSRIASGEANLKVILLAKREAGVE